jgi:hypothetical protein
MATYKFTPDIWIGCEYLNQRCIGRTMVLDGEAIVAIVTPLGQVGHIPFIMVNEPTKINFLNGKHAPNPVGDNPLYEPNANPFITLYGSHLGLN